MQFTKSISLALSLLLALGISSCTKYPDGPLLSLASKESRIAGTWVVEKAYESGVDKTGNYSDVRWTLSKDGDAKVTADVGGGIVAELDGIWELNSDGTIFIMQLTGNVLGFPFTQETEYTILRLTNKEFWLLQEDDDAEFQLKPF